MRYWITGSLLALAIICYFIGFGHGARILIALGIIFECAFWFRVFGRNHQQSSHPSSSDPTT